MMANNEIGMTETASTTAETASPILISNASGHTRLEIDACRIRGPQRSTPTDCVSPHSPSSSTTTMRSDDSTGTPRNNNISSCGDPPATAEFENGRFRSVEETTTRTTAIPHEPMLRLVEQETIEVSAEVFVDEIMEENPFETGIDPPSSDEEERSQEDIGMGDPSIHCEGVIELAEEDEGNDNHVQAAEIEIEEEDVDTRARELMPDVAEAIQQPNLHEVDVAQQSRLSVSALTTTFALEEDVKPPAFPSPNALGERNSTGSSSRQDQQVIFDDRTVSAMDVACADDAAVVPQLPNFKCQSQDYQPPIPQIPSPSPLTNVQVSGSSNTTRTDSTPDEIPVAPAVLVLDENNLTSSGASPPQSTLSRSTDPSTIHPPKLERNFWLTIIAITLFLNSLLVGGIVVAGFCAAGKCVDNSKASPDVVIEVLVPTPAPSRRLAASIAPSMAEPPGISETIASAPASPEDLPGVPPTIDAFVPPPTEMIDIPPTESMAPNQSPSTFGTVSNDPREENDDDDDMDGPSHDEPTDRTEGTQGIPMRLLILIGVLCEAMILSVVFCMYRRWRKRRQTAFQRLQKAAVSDRTSSSSDAV